MERDIFKIRTSFVAYSVEKDFKIRIVWDTPLSPRSSGVGNKNSGARFGWRVYSGVSGVLDENEGFS